LQSLHWELLDHPLYSPDLPVSDYHLSEPLKQHVGGWWFQNKEEEEMTIQEQLQIQKPDFYPD